MASMTLLTRFREKEIQEKTAFGRINSAVRMGMEAMSKAWSLILSKISQLQLLNLVPTPIYGWRFIDIVLAPLKTG